DGGEPAGQRGGQRPQPDDQAERGERADPYPPGWGFFDLLLFSHRPLDRGLVGRVTVRRPAVVDHRLARGWAVDGLGSVLVNGPVTVRHGRPSLSTHRNQWGWTTDTQRGDPLHRTMRVWPTGWTSTGASAIRGVPRSRCRRTCPAPKGTGIPT